MGEPAIIPRVLVFFDYSCPFCYIDDARIERLGERYDIDVSLAPFELRPEMPAEGVSLSGLGAMHSPRVEAHMMRVAREEGIPFDLPDFVPNTHAALVLGEVARDQGDERHREVHQAIFRAYFGQGRDIGQRSVLLDIAEEHDIDRDELARAWDDGTYDERLEAFAHVAIHLGVTATPAVLICDELFIGSRPTSVLAASVERCLLEHEVAEERAAEERAAEERPEEGRPEGERPAEETPSPEELESRRG